MLTCLFFVYSTYLFKAAQALVSQFPPFVKVQVGSSISLQCYVNPGEYCYAIAWLKMDQRSRIMSPCMNSQHSGSKTSQGEMCTYSIVNATSHHTGTYYCSLVIGNSINMGNGSTIVVSENVLEPFSIEILSPSDNDQTNVTLMCLVFGVIPTQAHVYWLISGNYQSGFTDSGWENKDQAAELDRKTEFTRNQILISSEIWASGAPCTCVVETENGRNFTKTVQYNGRSGTCLILLYTTVTVAVAAIILVLLNIICLFQGLQEKEARRGINSVSEVQYASLELDSHGRRTAVMFQ
nr:PREDICTED: uncharacterized protein LOC107075919 isoform X2 [Lepisosteus oculatus]